MAPCFEIVEFALNSGQFEPHRVISNNLDRMTGKIHAEFYKFYAFSHPPSGQ
jgi:hypothetical protein